MHTGYVMRRSFKISPPHTARRCHRIVIRLPKGANSDALVFVN